MSPPGRGQGNGPVYEIVEATRFEVAAQEDHSLSVGLFPELGFLARIAREELLASKLISLVDTPLPTKLPKGPKTITRGRLWIYLGDIDAVAYCDYSEEKRTGRRNRQGFMVAWVVDMRATRHSPSSLIRP